MLPIAAVASLLVLAEHLGYTLYFYVALELEQRTKIYNKNRPIKSKVVPVLN
jgi:hypothetical protein